MAKCRFNSICRAIGTSNASIDLQYYRIQEKT
jgi:hypothetical protein